MLGQMIVARFSGTIPSAAFLERIRKGQIGGVILFSDNVPSGSSATRALTRELQSEAARGGNPPLLIMTDQEGGEVRRLAGPPDLPAADMDSPGTASAEGAATGRLLRAVGVDVDLAPVADTEHVTGSFLGTRSFGGDPQTVASRACAFAQGLASQGIAFTLKHFPGLGRALGDTDTEAVSVDASAAELRADYRAYARCGAASRSLVMISSAIYPSLSGPLPAVMSRTIYKRELPLAVGGRRPVTISDDLQAVAISVQAEPARRAIEAGLDLLMYAQSEQASAGAYARLLAEVRAGTIPRAAISAADARITRLKRLLAQ
jgi:beta-N-acetylhexosaminidase